jgi:archaellum biogenesis ATPase FlaH
MNEFPIKINEHGRFTYMNLQTKEIWDNWKIWNDLSDEEKNKVNLGIPSNEYIIFDFDFKEKYGIPEGKELDNKILLQEYKKIKEQFLNSNITAFYSERTRAGFHIFAPFPQLIKLDEEIRKEVRKIYINKYTADPAKISMKGVVSLPNRPHFKTGNIYEKYDHLPGENKLKTIYIEWAKEIVSKRKENERKLTKALNLQFKDYFDSDSFFNYVKNNVIPDGTKRDLIIFPSLAIACVNSGKNREQIKELMLPIIQNNFPGKNWNEFEGWLEKAFKNEIAGYNPVLLNKWASEYLKKDNFFYDLRSININEVEEIDTEKLKKDEEPKKDTLKKDEEPKKDTLKKEKENKFTFYKDEELENIKFRNTEFLVEKWIPRGDISLVAGKSASYKTTTLVHFAYQIALGGLVFNKYQCQKANVLYLNEENSKAVMLGIIDRVKNGLNIKDEKLKNISFSFLENIRFDVQADLYHLIDYIKENNVEVLICDSFRRFIGFDENNATEMNVLFNNLKKIRKHCNNLTIIMLHHLKKGNNGYNEDIRDMLRGSSDLVNSADSIIGIDRKHGVKTFKIYHVKNRSGEEMQKKIIKIDGNEDENKAYFYETEDKSDKSLALKAEEICANVIIKELEDNNIQTFKKNELKKINNDFSYDIITKALRILLNEGSIIRQGKGPKTIYQRI